MALGHGNSVPRFHLTWGTGPGRRRAFLSRVIARTQRRGSSRSSTATRSIHWSPTRRCHRRSRHRSRTFQRPSRTESGPPVGRIRVPRTGCRRHLRRHRRQLRAGEEELAGTTRQGAEAHADRRTRTRRRTHARNHRIRGRQHRQPRPHVALHRRHPELESHLAQPRHPHHPRTVVDVVRRTGKRLPVPNFPGFDTMGTFKYILDSGHEYTWFILDQKIIEKEFALSGSEQNPDFTNRDLAPPRTHREGCTRPCRSLQAEGRGLRGAQQPSRPGRRHECPDRHATARLRGHRARNDRPRPRGRQQVQQGLPGHRHPRCP